MPQNHTAPNEFHFRSRRIFVLGELETPALVSFLLNRKWVKSEKQAAVVIISLIAVCVLLTAVILFNLYHQSDKVILADGTVITVEQYIEGLKSGKY
jgi:hypothetical protein